MTEKSEYIKSIELQNILLAQQIQQLTDENEKLSDKIELIVKEALPICDEIDNSRGFFRFIKVIKLTVKLVELIQANFTPLR